MTLRQYLSIMFVATGLCWASLVFVLFNVDPFTGGTAGFILFYLSIFFSILGTSSLVFFAAYHFFSKRVEPMFRYVRYSFRNSVIISFFVVILLLLQSGSYLKWWNFGILSALAVIVLAYSFIFRKNIRSPESAFNSPNLRK